MLHCSGSGCARSVESTNYSALISSWWISPVSNRYWCSSICLGIFIPTWAQYRETRDNRAAVRKGETLFHATAHDIQPMDLRNPSYFSITPRHPFHILLEKYDYFGGTGPRDITNDAEWYKVLATTGTWPRIFEYEAIRALPKRMKISGDADPAEIRLAWPHDTNLATYLKSTRTFLLDRAYVARVSIQKYPYLIALAGLSDTGLYEPPMIRRELPGWRLVHPHDSFQCYLLMRQAHERGGDAGRLAVTMAAHASAFSNFETGRAIFACVAYTKSMHVFSEPVLHEARAPTAEAPLFESMLTVVIGSASVKLPDWPLAPDTPYRGSTVLAIAIMPNADRKKLAHRLDLALTQLCHTNSTLDRHDNSGQFVLSLPYMLMDDGWWDEFPTFRGTLTELATIIHWVRDSYPLDTEATKKRAREEDIEEPAPKRTRYQEFPTELLVCATCGDGGMHIDHKVNKVYCQQQLCLHAARLDTFIPTW